MDAGQIRSAVLGIVQSLDPKLDPVTIRDDRPLREQVELDSLDWLNVIVGLHEKLHVEIPESDYGRLTTLDAIVAFVASKRGADAIPSGCHAARISPDSARTHELVDGSVVTVRPIRSDDSAMEADFVRHLSTDARYNRFMTTLRDLPADKLKYLTDVDYVHHVALVATVLREGKELEVGVARYVVDRSGTGCELAIAVDDAWQRSGVAGALMADLMEAARAAGLTRMEGIVLATNHQMLAFARRLGFDLRRDVDDLDTVRIERRL